MEYREVKALAAKIVKIKPDPLYQDFKRLFEEMAVHTREFKPTEKLIKARPNEPEEIIKYREENYESITYGSLVGAFDSLFRIFTSIGIKLFSGDEETDKYLLTKSFMNETFMMFYIKIYLKRMIEDANGWVIWLPGGEGAVNTNKQVDPYPELMFSFNLIDWQDEYIIFLANECSLIETKDGYERIGKIYYIITKDEYYTYTELTGGKYQLEIVYKHNFGEFPIIPLGGDLDADGLYRSFFRPFVALGNEATRQFSDWQALSVMASFPIREEFQINCEIHEVRKKKVRKGSSSDVAGENDLTDYKLTNKIVPLPRSMFGTIIRGGNSSDSEMGSKILDPNIPSVRFIAPGVEYVKNAFETFTSLLEMAEDNLHLNYAGSPGESGEAKKMNMLALEDMLNKIFSQLYDSMTTSMKYIVAYRKRIQPSKATSRVIHPASPRVKSEIELMEELAKLKSSNSPTMLIAAVARELAMLRFSGDEVNQKIFEVIATYDWLFTYSPAEKQSMLFANTALKEDVINSQYIYPALLNMSKQMGEAAFIEADSKILFGKFLQEVKVHYTKDPIIIDNNGNQA